MLMFFSPLLPKLSLIPSSVGICSQTTVVSSFFYQKIVTINIQSAVDWYTASFQQFVNEHEIRARGTFYVLKTGPTAKPSIKCWSCFCLTEDPHPPPSHSPEPVFVNLLRSPRIDSQPGGPVRNPTCCTGSPGYIGSRIQLLGIDS
jgi:hypothetical protein